jgi:MoaA/NifB/PqqE/SkfB family radical SAM enzyme
VLRRIDQLTELGTGIVTLSGGEPLLHPDQRRDGAAPPDVSADVVARDRIQRLNRSGPDHLQISIDNVVPDEVAKKASRCWIRSSGGWRPTASST